MATHDDPRMSPQNQPGPQFPPPGFTPLPAQQPYQGPAPEQFNAGGQGDYSTEPGFEDYFGFDIRHKYMLPDGRQYIEFKVLSEGDVAKYQQILRRDVVVEKDTGNARVRMDQVEERHALLQVAVTGWNLHRWNAARQQWIAQPFNNNGPGGEVMKWVKQANPQIIVDLAEAIRKENPFLMGAGAETLEAIDKEIQQLMERRKILEDRLQGEGASATK